MNNYQYDKPLRETYSALAVDLTSAAVEQTILGPAGMQGRVVNISGFLTTGATVAASTVTVGPNAAATPVTLDVAIAAINTGTAIPRANSSMLNQTLLAADTEVEIASGGEATAGVMNVTVTIEWF